MPLVTTDIHQVTSDFLMRWGCYPAREISKSRATTHAYQFSFIKRISQRLGVGVGNDGNLWHDRQLDDKRGYEVHAPED